MKRASCFSLGLVLTFTAALATGADGQELTDPLEILKKVDAAAKAVKAVKYDATFKPLGASIAQGSEVEGSVVMSGWTGGGLEKFLFEVTVKNAGSSDEQKVTAGGNGEEFFVIDHKTKTAYVDIDPAVLGRIGGRARNLQTVEFLHPTPFNDEIVGQKQELTGSKKIGGEDCYEVHVVYVNNRQEAIWHFSKKDFLPRGRMDINKDESGTIVRQSQRFLTNLEVDPKLDDSLFKVKVPEGYTKTDDFAP